MYTGNEQAVQDNDFEYAKAMKFLSDYAFATNALNNIEHQLQLPISDDAGVSKLKTSLESKDFLMGLISEVRTEISNYIVKFMVGIGVTFMVFADDQSNYQVQLKAVKKNVYIEPDNEHPCAPAGWRVQDVQDFVITRNKKINDHFEITRVKD